MKFTNAIRTLDKVICTNVFLLKVPLTMQSFHNFLVVDDNIEALT
jgi:hypothetical protein